MRKQASRRSTVAAVPSGQRAGRWLTSKLTACARRVAGVLSALVTSPRQEGERAGVMPVKCSRPAERTGAWSSGSGPSVEAAEPAL
jgi:hypothetical protein